MARLNQILFGIFLFIFPFSVRFLVYEENAYRFGNFSPWVSEFVYAPEILLVVVFGMWAYERRGRFLGRSPQATSLGMTIGVLFILNALIVTFWRGDGVLGLFWMWRILEAGMLVALIRGWVLELPKIIRILFWGALFQVVLGFLQWQLNHSVGLPCLGEPVIGSAVLNVAKINFAEGVKHIRAYGTFLHPNILAGYFLVILFLAFDYFKTRSKILWLLLIGLGLWLAQSLAAFLVGIVCLLFWIFFRLFPQREVQKLFSGFIILFLILGNMWFFLNNERLNWSDASFRERLEQNVISREMFQARPLGVGVRNFTLAMENFTERKLAPWEFQPVHNAYFLVLNETGMQGLLLLVAIIGWLFLRLPRVDKMIPLFCLLLLAPFDHFLWDSWVGMMLIALAIGFFTVRLQDQGPALRP